MRRDPLAAFSCRRPFRPCEASLTFCPGGLWISTEFGFGWLPALAVLTTATLVKLRRGPGYGLGWALFREAGPRFPRKERQGRVSGTPQQTTLWCGPSVAGFPIHLHPLVITVGFIDAYDGRLRPRPLRMETACTPRSVRVIA